MRNLFAGAFDREWLTAPLPVDVTFPTETEVQKAAELVSQAKKPLIILGSQAVLPPIGAQRLRNAIEVILILQEDKHKNRPFCLFQALGIPVYLGGMARGLLGRNSSINMRQARRDALREADVVILGGGVADFRLGYGKVFSKRSKVIAINRSKEQLYKNTRVFWNPELAIQADAAKFFVNLADRLKGHRVDDEWVRHLKARDEEKESKAKQMADVNPGEHLNPLKVSFLCLISLNVKVDNIGFS